MNFLLQGNFKIEDSWKKNKRERSRSRSNSRDKSNRSILQAGKNIVESTPDILDDQVQKYVLKEFQAEVPPPPSVKSIRS